MERKEIFEMGKRIQTKETAGEEGVVRKGPGVEGKWKETEGRSGNERREASRIWTERKISVLRRRGKAEWAIIDIKFREREKGRKWKGWKPESSRDPLFLIKVIIPPSGAHTHTHTERIERRSQFSWLSKNEPFDERQWRAERRACACMCVCLSGPLRVSKYS